LTNVYDGREQSQAKHDIYARYLIPFASKILHKWPTLDVIDGFAGPWENTDTEDLSDTSIGVSIKELSKVAENLRHSPAAPKIRCIFNEADPSAYKLLKEFIDRSRPQYPLLKLMTFQGKFEQNATAIDTAANHQFRLLFVDPTGYSGFPPSCLKIFGVGRSQEIIVNMMRSFLVRQATGGHRDTHSNLVGLLGKARADRLIAGGEFSIETIEEQYLLMLKEDLGFKYAAYTPIHNPDKDTIHFNLAYGTNHHDGLEELRKAEFVALSAHDRNRFSKSLIKRGGDLFGDMFDGIEVRGPYLRMRTEHSNRCGAVIRSILMKRGSIQFCELCARVQEQLYLKRSEIGSEVVRLTSAGTVANTWQVKRQQKPREKDMIALSPGP
jgi:three-Cys-motif partner protein